MTIATFIRELEQRGVTLRADGDSLALRAPKGVLTEADRERLRAEKAAILACLTVPVDEAEPFPLTDIQQAYLIGRAAEMELGRVGCHAYREFEHPALDIPRLEQAWNRLVARHPMLRAVFTEDGRQRVLPEVPEYRIAVLDLRGAADAETRLAALREERSHRVHEPARWPLFEIHATLLPGRVRLSVGIDLLVADAAALITLFREWGALYAVPERELPPVTGRFADHVRRLPAVSPADRAYWDARLDSLPPGPDLPRLAAVGPARFSRRSLRLAPERWRALKQAAQGQGLTPSALVAAVYAEVLAAWSRRARFSLTLTQFGAPPGMAGVVGDFTSTILLEVDTTPPCFRDRAIALQRRLLADLDHSGQSGVAVLRELRRRRPDFEPVSVVFTSTLGHPGLDPDAPSPLAWLGTTVHAITQTPQVAMDHHVLEEDGALVAAWDVVEALFPPGVLDAMVGAYGRLLDDLAAGIGWDQRVVDACPPASRAPLVPGPAPALLHAAFERQAAATPARAAVIALDRTFDYAELDRAATRLAARITAEWARLGNGAGYPRTHSDTVGSGSSADHPRAPALAGPDDASGGSHRLLRPLPAPEILVAVEQPKGWRQIVAVLAVLKAGAAYVPIDPSLPAERRRHLLERTGAIVLDPSWFEAALEGPVPSLPPVGDPSRLAYVIYTSGSTGQPKGVMIEHRAAVTTVAEINRLSGLGPDDRVLGLSSLSFDLSVWDIFGPLSVGGALVLPPPEAARDPAAWSELLVRHRITVWNSVPALMAMQVEHGLPAGHAVRLVMMSGDWVPLPLVGRLQAEAPETRLVALGGATEAAIWSNAHEIGTLDPGWPSVPYGTGLAGQALRVVNERGEDCPDWVTGEIQIAGAGLARGYWGDPDRTAERFVQQEGERRYRTGDLARFRPYAGSEPTPLEFLGREDFQVKVQGHRIELGEIEAVIATHPDVAEVAVAALPQGSDKALHAFVVPRRLAWDRAKFLLERHGLRRLPEVARHVLPGRPEAESYARRSIRRFAPEPVALDALGAVLAAAGCMLGGSADGDGRVRLGGGVADSASPDGVGCRGSESQEARKGSLPTEGDKTGRDRTAVPLPRAIQQPSSSQGSSRLSPAAPTLPTEPAEAAPGAALAIRLIVTRVDGLASGLWRYEPATHCLHHAGPAPGWSVPDSGTARVADAAAFLVLFDANTANRRAALLAAGAAGQRMMHAAQAAGLGLCPIGVLLRDGAPVLHSFAGGAPAAETAGFDLAGAVREHAAAQLPAWMVPRHVHLRETLPLSANGKLDRAALRPPEAAGTVATDTALAARVGALVAEIIGYPVHPQQNLFDCGATSLHIVRLQRRLAEDLGSRLGVVDLFRLPSVATLAGAIAGEAGPDAVDAGLARAARRRQMRGRGGA